MAQWFFLTVISLWQPSVAACHAANICYIQSFHNPPKLLVSLLICDNRFHIVLSAWNHFLILMWNAFPFRLFLFYYYKGQIKKPLSPDLPLIFYLSVDPSFSSWVKSCLERITTVTSLSKNHVSFPLDSWATDFLLWKKLCLTPQCSVIPFVLVLLLHLSWATVSKIKCF